MYRTFVDLKISPMNGNTQLSPVNSKKAIHLSRPITVQ